MGHRANYVVVQNGARELWYSHWTASSLTRDLFWGPEHALPFIRRQVRTEDWLDDVWCEGAALVDLDHEVLILFGGEDLMRHVLPRRVYLRLLAHVWTGWSVRWAFEELADIVEYLGLDRAIVSSGRKRDFPTPPGPPELYTDSIASVRLQGGQLGLYEMDCRADYLIEYGADLLPLLRKRRAQQTLTLPADCSGGVHVDVGSRKVDFWLSIPAQDMRARAAARWPGWTVEWHRDSFEEQSALTGGALAFETPSDDELFEHVRSILDIEPSQHHGEQMRNIALQLQEEEGKPWQVNPAALVDAPQAVPADLRRQILLSSIRADRRR